MADSALTVSVKQAKSLTGLGRSFIYLAIQRGELPIRKAGRRTLILRQDLETWLKSLPRGNRISERS